jgi:hypothetical protein
MVQLAEHWEGDDLASLDGLALAGGTTKKSMETRSWVWFRRNVHQLCDGGFVRRGMCRDTVASPTSKPSMINSP